MVSPMLMLKAGMFIFARLICHNLFSQTSSHNLERELQIENFPKTLDEMYLKPSCDSHELISLQGTLVS
jgi:hypothetical protein